MASGPRIEGYGADSVRIDGISHRGGVLVLPGGVIALAAPTLAAASETALAPLLAAAEAIDLLLIGCGARSTPLPAGLREACRRARIGLEVLDTGAACRAYGLLQAEGRRVAALLVPIAPAQ